MSGLVTFGWGWGKKPKKHDKNQKMGNFSKNVKNAPTLTLNIWGNRFPDLPGLGGV